MQEQKQSKDPGAALLVQLLVWYLLLMELLPDAAQAWQWQGAIFLSKAGLSLPWLAHDAAGWHWSLPALEGFSMEGGATLTPDTGTLTLTGLAPGVLMAGANILTATFGTLTLTGKVPANYAAPDPYPDAQERK